MFHFKQVSLSNYFRHKDHIDTSNSLISVKQPSHLDLIVRFHKKP